MQLWFRVGIQGRPSLGIDRSELLRDFQNFLGPGPVPDFTFFSFSKNRLVLDRPVMVHGSRIRFQPTFSYFALFFSFIPFTSSRIAWWLTFSQIFLFWIMFTITPEKSGLDSIFKSQGQTFFWSLYHLNDLLSIFLFRVDVFVLYLFEFFFPLQSHLVYPFMILKLIQKYMIKSHG